MSFKHVIITRFSFRFRESDPKFPLMSEKRLMERIRIFRDFCFPSIAGQTNKNFSWILIIDPELPEKFRLELMSIFEDFRKTPAYESHGPRNLWLHEWNWEKYNLGKIDWILPYISCNNLEEGEIDEGEIDEGEIDENKQPLSEKLGFKYLVTTRLDDDDCLHFNFVDNVARQVQRPARDLREVSGFRYLSYCHGYQYQVNSKILRRTRIPLIALGLTLIAEVDKYPLCAYFGNHKKIEQYVRKPDTHPEMLALYQKNRDLPVDKKQILNRLLFIRSKEPAYVRNVHEFNLQKNIPRHKYQSNTHLRMISKVMKDYFQVEI